MSTVTFVHPNTGAKIDIFVDTIVAVSYMPEQKTTVLIGIGNAVVPVKGEQEDAVRQIKEAKEKGKEDQTNV